MLMGVEAEADSTAIVREGLLVGARVTVNARSGGMT